MARLQTGGIGWERSPVTVKEFFGTGLIDELLADKHLARQPPGESSTEKPTERLTKAQREYQEGQKHVAAG